MQLIYFELESTFDQSTSAAWNRTLCPRVESSMTDLDQLRDLLSLGLALEDICDTAVRIFGRSSTASMATYCTPR